MVIAECALITGLNDLKQITRPGDNFGTLIDRFRQPLSQAGLDGLMWHMYEGVCVVLQKKDEESTMNTNNHFVGYKYIIITLFVFQLKLNKIKESN